MCADDAGTDQKSRDEQRAHRCQEDDEDGEEDEATEGFAVREGAAENDKGLIRGPEEIEESPGREEREEEEEGERVGKKGEGEDDGDDGGVVDAEIGEVLADAGEGVRKGFRAGQGGAVQEFVPRPAIGERAAEGVGEA